MKTNLERSFSGKQPSTAAESPRKDRRGARLVRFARTSLLGFLVVFLCVTLVGPPAWAHGGESPDEGYVMVQQALSYLVNDTSPAGTAKALGKVNETLAAADQDGVEVAGVEQAKTALSAGDTKTARALLQESITEAVAELKPAVGEETGTTIMVAPYAQGPLTVTDWVFVVLSVFVAIGGMILAIRFRPSESMRDLRRDILAGEDKTQSTPLESKGSERDVL